MTRYLPLSEKKGQLAITNRTQLSVTFFKVALLFCFLFITFSAHAQTVTPAGGIVYVKKGGAGNSSGDSWGNACAELATALKAAENNSNIKQIWVAEGTYTPMYKAGNGDTERDKAFVLVKDVKIYGGFAGTETTLEARDLNPLSHPTILNGDLGAADSAYHVVIAAGNLGTALLDGLTITGGKANNDDLPTDPPPMVPRNCGGGIYSASSIEISHVIIRDNRAVRGGGIYNTAYNNTASKLTHVHILRNGIPRQRSNGTLTTESQGGGVYNANCTATFDSVRIENNVSRQGGGIYNQFGQPKFTKMIISGNKATKSGSNGEGGGIYNYESSPEYTNAVISGNEAATNGGGIYNNNASSKLTNVLLSGNKADNGGGMYHNGASIPVLTNVTIAGNYATSSGGGTYNLANGYNLIIWGNAAGSSDNNAAGAYPNHTSNLVEGVNITGGMDGTNSANDPLFLAPKLATEAPTTAGNYRITLCSPVYNQGDDTRYDNSGIGAGKPNLTAVTTDLDGNPRKAGAHVDLGAYESTAITPAADNKIYVNKNVSQHTPPDYDGSSWVNATPVLADALLFAAKNAGIDYEIWVAEGTYTPRYSATDCRPNGRNNTFVLPPNVKLYGGFTGTETARGLNPLSHPTILSGDLGAIGNAYHVMVIDGAGSAVLDGFIITGGKADGSGDASNGGGLYIAGGSGVTPTIEHVIVSGNEASDGGGMYIAAGTAPKIVSTLVSGNKASGGGGGIYHDGASAVLTNLTISGNNATNGSGIYATGGTLTVYNSIVWGNGSGTNNVYGSPTYHYSLVQGTDLSGSNSNLDGTGDTNNPKFMDPVAAASAPATGGNYRLNVCGSPVSDKGYTGAPNLGSTDLDGMARKSSGGSIIALGAYEKLPSSTTVTGTTLYVNKNVSGGTGDGSSWDNAFRELSDALRIAAGTTVNEIWVAQGTYYPLYSAVSASASVASCDNGNRDNAFVMLPDVKIYGGFTGSEISLAARNWEAHPTILSGDIGISGDPADNAYHVVIGSGITNAAVLDGFTITGGNANGSGSITVQGQTVSQNQGGGVMLHTASPAIAHVKISGNQATDGAGASLDAASPNISNTLISGNKATASGGGMYANTTSVPTLLNVTISGNNAANGSGIFNYGGTAPTVKNCIIWGNTANNVNFDNTTITYSLVEGISVNNSKHMRYGNLPGTTDPQFIAAVDAGQAPTVGGNYRVRGTSAVVEQGDVGSYTNNDKDLAAAYRRSGTNGNGGYVDMGAYQTRKKNVSIGDFIYPPTAPTTESYNCQPHPIEVTPKSNITGMGAITVTYTTVAGILGVVSEQSVPVPVNAGAYYVYINVANGDEYYATTIATRIELYATNRYTISRSNPAATSFDFEPKSVPFDGSPHGVTLTAQTGYCLDGLSPIASTTPDDLSLVQIKYVCANPSYNSTTPPTAAGTYSIQLTTSADGKGYNKITTALTLGNFTISSPSTPTPTASDLSFALPKTETYNGQPHPVAVTKLSSVGTITVYYSGTGYSRQTNAPVNAGTYTVSVDITANLPYFGAVTDLELGTLTINKAEVTAALFDYTPKEVTYNGSPQGVNVTVTSGVTGLGAYTVSYQGTSYANGNYAKTATKPTNAGSYYVLIDAPESANYHAKSNLSLGDFPIHKREATVTFSASAIAYGDPLSASTLTCNVDPADASGMSAWVDDTVYPRVGNAYPARFTSNAGKSDNYNYDNPQNGVFDQIFLHQITVTQDVLVPITPKTISVSGVSVVKIDGEPGKRYDGSTSIGVDISGATLSGTLPGDAVTIVAGVGTLDDPNAGSRNVTFSGFTLGGADGGNYVLSAQPAGITATVLPKKVGLSVEPIPAQIYDGTPKTPPIIVLEMGTNDKALIYGVDFTTSYSDNVEAGKDAVVDVTGIGNYAGSFGKAKFTINPATPLLVIRQDDIAYGVTPNPVVVENTSKGAVTFSYKERDASGDYSAQIPTKAGDYTVRGIAAATENYESVTAYDDFTIDAMWIPFLDYAVIKWNNTLILNKKKLNNEGIEVEKCQWFKNGTLLPEPAHKTEREEFTWSKGPLASDKLDAGDYSFVLSSSSHGIIKSYHHSYVSASVAAVKAYPNPAASGEEVKVEGCGDGYIEIFNAMGKLVKQVKTNGHITVLTFNQPSGVYFIKTNNQTIKVIIKK